MKGQSHDDQAHFNISITIEEHIFVQIFHDVLTHYCFKQGHEYGLKHGLRMFGEEGMKAAYKEMEQLHLRNCFEPLNADSLTGEKKRKALNSLLFLKRNASGETKSESLC